MPLSQRIWRPKSDIILKKHPTPAAAWSVEIIYQAVTAILSFLFLFYGKWQNKKL